MIGIHILFWCIRYTNLVYIRLIRGTKQKRHPLGDKGWRYTKIYRLYRILYIVDLSTFSAFAEYDVLHKILYEKVD